MKHSLWACSRNHPGPGQPRQVKGIVYVPRGFVGTEGAKDITGFGRRLVRLPVADAA